MGCDQLVEADVLLADGRTVTCSATREPDLFWALRGAGGGNLGVVTGYRLRAVALESVVNYTVNWPWQHAAAVLAAWQEWVVSGAAELGSSLLIVLPNAAEDAVPIVTVIGMHAGEPAQAERELSRFAALVGQEPSVRACAPLPYQKAIMQWYGGEGLSVRECHVEGHNPDAKLPRGPWQRSRNRLLDSPVPEAALQEILDAYAADRRAGHTRVFNAFALGGRAGEVDRDATAYVHRDAFAMFGAGDAITGAVADEAEVRAGQEWADRVFDVVDRYSTGESYQNYIDSALPDWQHAYYGGNYARLQEVKRVYDPDRVFDFAQAIGR
jgi:FAD/FMN-containing dehydrogenase